MIQVVIRETTVATQKTLRSRKEFTVEETRRFVKGMLAACQKGEGAIFTRYDSEGIVLEYGINLVLPGEFEFWFQIELTPQEGKAEDFREVLEYVRVNLA